ncbi:DUF4189 domain-containing protein, partial [Xanthomonas euvesicatoria]|uniref:DUF4189 domain-containing protein n=1 Tax=Xanthomonas euvesicatoria TaxID=456327 RepID=UPI001E4FD335
LHRRHPVASVRLSQDQGQLFRVPLSRQEAEKKAVQLCAEGGATDCKVDLSYKNQCAASVSSDKKSFLQGAESKDVAINLAMRDCKDHGGGECKVIYSGCSDPIFKKY